MDMAYGVIRGPQVDFIIRGSEKHCEIELFLSGVCSSTANVDVNLGITLLYISTDETISSTNP